MYKNKKIVQKSRDKNYKSNTTTTGVKGEATQHTTTN